MIKISDRQKRLIEKKAVVLATSDLESRPNVIAVAYCRIVAADKILITDNFMNKTGKNLFW